MSATVTSTATPASSSGLATEGINAKNELAMMPTEGTCASAFSIPDLDPKRVELIENSAPGVKIEPLEPIGAKVSGINLRGPKPSEEIIKALEAEMANRGFLVFKNQPELSTHELCDASCWWGGKEMHSTHGVHPATPDNNRHIFRLSNDQKHGILGVGPQWHNDGSFEAPTFSHVGYYMVRVPENGGATFFAHQGAAFDALPPEKQDFWSRLTSVNSNSGVAHPLVHEHPISGRKSVWLHLGMTGAVIEKLPNVKEGTPVEKTFRLLNEDEMKKLFHGYNDLLNAGLKDGYTVKYDYEPGDCIFIDNFAVAHRASPEAHKPPSEQGLRIMHRTTVKAMHDEFPPTVGLPQYINIYGPHPFNKDGVWRAGGIGFRWDDSIHMQN